VAEVDLRVQPDPGQDGQEAGVQGLQRRTGRGGFRGMFMGKDLRRWAVPVPGRPLHGCKGPPPARAGAGGAQVLAPPQLMVTWI